MKKIFGISALVVLVSAIAVAVIKVLSDMKYDEDVTEDGDDNDFDDFIADESIEDEIKVEATNKD